MNNGESVTPPTQRLAVEQTELTQQLRKQKLALAGLTERATICDNQLTRRTQQLRQHRSERTQLESRRRNFKHDVELDSAFSVLSVGLVMAVTFVFKEYFTGT